MPQTFTSLHYHIVFSTKHREPIITPDFQPRLYEYLGGIVRSQGGELVAAGGMPDHIHILVRLNQQHAVADVMRVLKANSSGWVHETFAARNSFAWQTGYGAFTAGLSTMSRVKAYIANQAEHHKRVTFQDELRSFLKKHEIEYDERYLWD
ncbi:IS200/IS605 family transposase [Limnoglobus roseus]|uniref:IS200/IS605 family transposase n=1 Tax=Limnoglobus roseus TaxID=2598579 RepID=A0A5C1A868_9BACT|nr:IS200/IS605 family transposase [Limnoglobus roseus]QEL14383.1 IS200/IS605 family transposase [Limnoglobus roseus]